MQLSNKHQTLVMKFGGASVATPEQFSRIADIIISRSIEYPRVAVVVSAMGDTTNQLIELAKKVNPDPPRREYDMLVTVGERISISLLAMALAMKKREAVSFTGSQSGIITCARHTDARIVDVKPYRIESCLEGGKIAIVAGFQGVSRNEKNITTLGRGGSDTTAVALGVALGASKVEFFKDVPGVYNDDPKKNQEAMMYEYLSYEAALDIIRTKGAKILHSRCVELAKKNALPLHVLSFQENFFGKNQGTVIHDTDLRREMMPRYEDDLQENR